MSHFCFLQKIIIRAFNFCIDCVMCTMLYVYVSKGEVDIYVLNKFILYVLCLF